MQGMAQRDMTINTNHVGNNGQFSLSMPHLFLIQQEVMATSLQACHIFFSSNRNTAELGLPSACFAVVLQHSFFHLAVWPT